MCIDRALPYSHVIVASINDMLYGDANHSDCHTKKKEIIVYLLVVQEAVFPKVDKHRCLYLKIENS